ncbi:MAG TPA: tetratricopeptide repeat protein [Thermodesulfovibrionales bacterium]|nr:tetratricopeptide repeat protein [Thermodesulfovibrionales bacterium]
MIHMMGERIRSIIKFLNKNSIGVVLLLAAVLRVGHVLSLIHLPLFESLMLDSQLYDQWAQRIADGDWIGGDSAFYMDPLYSYTLALLYRVFGHNLLLVRLFQAALGVATCGLVCSIGYRIGGKAVGTIAALIVALYQPLIFEGAEIEKTALGVFLITVSLAFAIQGSVASKFGAGVSLALAALTRGNLLLMAPFGTILFLSYTETGELRTRTLGFTERWREMVLGRSGRSAAAFLLGFLLMLFPILWRNHHVSGEWILTTSQAGTNFYTGNNPSNESGTFSPVPFVRPSPRYEEADFRTKAEEITGRRLSSGEVSSFWFYEAIKHILQHPGFAAMVFFRKFTLFWGDFEVPDGWSIYFIRQYSPALHIAFLTLGWLLPLAVLGVIASIQVNRSVRLLVGYIAAYSFSVIAFFVYSRYRIYVVPPLAIFAALGLRWSWEHVRGRDWRHIIPGAFVAGCVCVFSFMGVSSFVGIEPENFTHNYAHLAKLYEDKGDFKSAEALLREGMQRNPEAAPILCGLGEFYLRTGDPKQAFIHINQCLQEDEYFMNAWFQLGQANEGLGNIDQAILSYQRQLEIVPGHQFARMRLENLMTPHEKTSP